MGVAVAVSVTAVPASAAPEITLRPGSLARGADPSIPVVIGNVLVDGARRVPLPDSSVLIGASNGDYVVWTSDGARRPSIWRVQPDGDSTLLMRSQGGLRLGAVDRRRRARDPADAGAGPRDGRHPPRRRDRRRAAARRRSPGSRTSSTSTATTWSSARRPPRAPRSGTSRRARSNGSAGAPATRPTSRSDRLAVLTDDPYDGGCSVVSTLSDPAAVLSESCTERVTDFSPDGRRLALVDLLTDGLGPNRVDRPHRGWATRGDVRRTVLLRPRAVGDLRTPCCSRPTARDGRRWSGACAPRASGPPGSGRPRLMRSPQAAFRLPGPPAARP